MWNINYFMFHPGNKINQVRFDETDFIFLKFDIFTMIKMLGCDLG